MKTLAASLLALGLLATTASAQYCPPGGHGAHRPTQTRMPAPIKAPEQPAAVPADPAPTPDPVPQK